MHRLLSFAKREFVFVIAALAAVVSMVLVPVDGAYAAYIDYRVIGLLFSLMLVIQALIHFGLFSYVSHQLINRAGSVRSLSLILVVSVFFFSMLVTNDVSLLTFVPLTLMVYPTEDKASLRFVVVMETIAANLGSMAFPFGNPQNLYLYNHYQMPFSLFFRAVLPVTLLSLALLVLAVLLRRYSGTLRVENAPPVVMERTKLWVSLVLFVLCILTALRVLDYRLVLAIVSVGVLVLDRRLFSKVDYALLGTFVFFFIFVGNLARIPAVTKALGSTIGGREFLYGVLVSQVISNVPAAILLSSFTTDAVAVVLGTDIGGLGTLIASLASLISFKAYTKSGDSHRGRYLVVFTIWNVLFLVILCVFAALFLL